MSTPALSAPAHLAVPVHAGPLAALVHVGPLVLACRRVTSRSR
ncbi:hypothetical protein [Streptomyces sp. NBC_00690]|nr:hypothetical protein [Streptomyces sp. NBC_00690]